MKLAQYLYPGQ